MVGSSPRLGHGAPTPQLDPGSRSGFGHLAFYLAGSRRRIAKVNIDLCFPELTPQQRDQLLKDNLLHTGMGLAEATIPWMHPKRDLRNHMQINGLEHLNAAKAAGNGVLLLGGHYTCIDISCQPLGDQDMDVMYRANKNLVWEWLQVRGRRHFLTTWLSAATCAKPCAYFGQDALFGTHPIKTMDVSILYLRPSLMSLPRLFAPRLAWLRQVNAQVLMVSVPRPQSSALGRDVHSAFLKTFLAATTTATPGALMKCWKHKFAPTLRNTYGCTAALKHARRAKRRYIESRCEAPGLALQCAAV